MKGEYSVSVDLVYTARCRESDGRLHRVRPRRNCGQLSRSGVDTPRNISDNIFTSFRIYLSDGTRATLKSVTSEDGIVYRIKTSLPSYDGYIVGVDAGDAYAYDERPEELHRNPSSTLVFEQEVPIDENNVYLNGEANLFLEIGTDVYVEAGWTGYPNSTASIDWTSGSETLKPSTAVDYEVKYIITTGSIPIPRTRHEMASRFQAPDPTLRFSQQLLYGPEPNGLRDAESGPTYPCSYRNRTSKLNGGTTALFDSALLMDVSTVVVVSSTDAEQQDLTVPVSISPRSGPD